MSKKKIAPVRRADHGDTTALQAFDEVVRAIKRWSDAIGISPNDAVKEALQDLAGALHDADESRRSPVVQKSTVEGGRRGREYEDGLSDNSAVAIDKTRGRHDEKALPSGYTYDDGVLVGPPLVIKKPDEETVLLARSLILSLACQFSLTDASGLKGQLFAFIRPYVDASRPSGLMHKDVEAIKGAWEAYFGEDVGTPRWVGALANQLEMDARHREEERQRKLRGDRDPADRAKELWPEVAARLNEALRDVPSGALQNSASGAEIHLYLSSMPGIDLPSQLTAERIEAMRGMVGLNGRGRSGKRTARSVATAFWKALQQGRE